MPRRAKAHFYKKKIRMPKERPYHYPVNTQLVFSVRVHEIDFVSFVHVKMAETVEKQKFRIYAHFEISSLSHSIFLYVMTFNFLLAVFLNLIHVFICKNVAAVNLKNMFFTK